MKEIEEKGTKRISGREDEQREREREKRLPFRKGFWLHGGQNSSRKWNFFMAIPRSRTEKASVAIHRPSPPI